MGAFMSFLRNKCVCAFTLTASVLLAAAIPAQEVTLPLEDYESLRQRAEPTEVSEPIPSVPIALEAADIELSAGPESARVTMRMTV